ncbi:uncharacterized protein IWZ02DRAFT_461842 [Phyllosticta citriasiana]|uniref:Uncharacterized protein n=1 Tax=Phyllosticta citriasiana TaxID=595635 RepID=A0ABR1L2I1_9PEZI
MVQSTSTTLRRMILAPRHSQEATRLVRCILLLSTLYLALNAYSIRTLSLPVSSSISPSRVHPHPILPLIRGPPRHHLLSQLHCPPSRSLPLSVCITNPQNNHPRSKRAWRIRAEAEKGGIQQAEMMQSDQEGLGAIHFSGTAAAAGTARTAVQGADEKRRCEKVPSFFWFLLC